MLVKHSPATAQICFVTFPSSRNTTIIYPYFSAITSRLFLFLGHFISPKCPHSWAGSRNVLVHTSLAFVARLLQSCLLPLRNPGRKLHSHSYNSRPEVHRSLTLTKCLSRLTADFCLQFDAAVLEKARFYSQPVRLLQDDQCFAQAMAVLHASVTLHLYIPYIHMYNVDAQRRLPSDGHITHLIARKSTSRINVSMDILNIYESGIQSLLSLLFFYLL